MTMSSSRLRRRTERFKEDSFKLISLFKGKSSLQLLATSFLLIIPLSILMGFWQVNKAFRALRECEKMQLEISETITLILSSCSNTPDIRLEDFTEKCTKTCPLGYKYQIGFISNSPIVYCPLHGNLANKSQSRTIPLKQQAISNQSEEIHLYPELNILPSTKPK